ncbi:hypothetical protein CSUI_003448 [Cystoisospora suis]|uniref:Uncharacterized protein n=1 Tax=Cystoisospora suis TaxID=483139 RepID=A0A2C6L4X9_9APIC|nr:hypothetical protein CSUI_003448 [Cystoisospora suis]
MRPHQTSSDRLGSATASTYANLRPEGVQGKGVGQESQLIAVCFVLYGVRSAGGVDDGFFLSWKKRISYVVAEKRRITGSF